MITFFFTTLLTILSTVNPPNSIPILISITEGEEALHVRRLVRRSTLVVISVLSLFTLLGHYVLQFFHLSIAAISIAGGIILFSIALKMVQAERIYVKSRPEEQMEARDKPDPSIVPLAIPMLAGPGSLTTVLILAGQSQGYVDTLTILLAIVLTGFIAYFVLSRAIYLNKMLGKTGINILTRLMGLLLAALAVQFTLNGIAMAIPDILSKLN